MQLIILLDLFDISKKLIIKKGAVVNFQLVHQLMLRGKKLKKAFVLFGETQLMKDFKNIFNEEQYFTIFTPDKINEEIIKVANNTKITKEIVEELKNIKENLPYTFRHTLSVTALAIKMALDIRNKGYDPPCAAMIGLTHDLGKSRVPKQLLGKDTPLTQSEYNLLKTHSLLGYILLCYYLGSDFCDVLDAARDHHEKLDGSGYPRGITKVSKYAKIITPVDIFDALISERPYRGSPFTIRQAVDHLIDESVAGRVDKEILYYLISYIRKEHPRPEELKPYETKSPLTRSDTAYGKIIPD